MLKKRFGKTNIDVSVIGAGGMRFESPYEIDENASIMKKAYDMGINYFDTAPLYCNDKSEIIYGTAIKEMLKTRNEKPFYIATKSNRQDPAKVREDLEKSLKRLNVDCIDFYYFWCIVTPEVYQKRKANGVLKEFEKLKQEGLIKNICVSTHMNGDGIKDMLNEYPFDAVLIGYSAMNFAYREKGIQAAADLDMGVAVMNPLGGGNIPQHEDLFEFLKSSPSESVVQAALRFLINDKRISTSIVGFKSEKEVEEAVSAVEGYKPISNDKINEIRESLKKSFDQLCTACQYCDHCPQGIPIPKLLDAYNFYFLSGKKPESLINRLAWHWGITVENEYLTKCNECGKCELLCTQKLPIRERLKEIRKIAEEELLRLAEKKK